MSANPNVSRRVLAAVACGTALLMASSSYAGPTRNRVGSVDHREIGSATKILIRGTVTPTFTVYKLERPARIIVDVANAALTDALAGDEAKTTWQLNTWAVGQVAAHPMGDRGAVVRVVVGLARPATYKVEAVGKDVMVIVTPRDPKPADTSAAERDRAARAQAEAERARREATEANQRTAAAEAAAEAAQRNASSARADAASARRKTAAARAETAQAAQAAQAAAAEAAKLEQQLTAARAETRVAKQLIAEVKAEAEQARRDMEAAKAEAEQTVTAAKSEATRAKREAEQMAQQSGHRVAEAETKMKQAERSLAEAQRVKQESEATEQAARAAAEQAAKREATARDAEKRAAARQAEADRAASAARRYQRDAADARGGSGKAIALRQRAEQAAREAEQRRSRAERAAKLAEQRREEAERAAAAAESRKEQAAQVIAAAEQQRVAAEKERSVAVDQLATVEAELREAERRSKAAQADAKAAVELAERAKSLRAQEEAAYQRTVTARKQAERRRLQADRAAAELEASIKAAASAQSDAEKQRAQAVVAQQAVAEKERRAVGSRAIEAARAEASKMEKARAQAEAILATRRAEVDKQRDKLARLRKNRDSAASDLADLRRAAGEARAKREHEEQQLAELKQRRVAAERELERTRRASAEAERSADRARRNAATAQAEAAAAADQAAADQAKAAKARAQARAAKAAADQAVADRSANAEARAAEARAAEARAAEAEARAAKAEARATAKAKSKSKTKTSAKSVKPAPQVAKSRVRDINFVDADKVARVVVAMSAPAEPRVVSQRGRKAVLEIPGASLADELERTLDVTRFKGPIEAVSSYRDPNHPTTIRIEVQLAAPTAGVLKKVGNTYHWEFAKPAKPTAKKRVASATPKRRTRASTNQPPPAAAGGYGGSSTPITQQTVAQVSSRRAKVYRGTKIDLDFKDADIHNLLRLLADVGGVNIVIPDEINYRVTVRMRRVPWDQALEVILASKGLWYERNGNLYRIAPRKELDAQAQAEAERLQAMMQSEVPDTEYITLNYANAKDVAKNVTKMLSPKGDLQVDDRTNTIVVIDVKANRRKIVDLLRRLDTATPQIQIEARIVEARSSFTREFGVQWGGSAIMSGATGNSTGLVFPNNVGIVGGSDSNQAPTGGINVLPSDFAVNLPAATGAGSGGAIGLQLGSVGGNFGLNLRLSALEDQGTIRIISAPKITVINNTRAEISQGVSIPVSVVSANGVQTQFVPADLSLKVTPTVSQADCSVTLDVEVKKNEADFVNTGSRGDPSILRKEAKTKILIADGATTVIGGIYTRNTGLSYSKVPFFGDLPVFGWFFKHRKENDERTEVLVFITPKITNKAALRCEAPTMGVQ